MFKRAIIGFGLYIMIGFQLFAVDIHIGLRVEGAMTRAYGNVGAYSFIGQFDDGGFLGLLPPNPSGIFAVRSLGQLTQFSGGVGVYVQIGINRWYTFMPEVMFGFNRGLSYTGNYDRRSLYDDANDPLPDFPELTGEMRYGWTVINFNLLNQFTVIRPNDMFSFHLLAGPSISVILGNVKEDFRPDFASYNRPFDEAYTRRFNPGRRFDIGIIAGFGSDIDFGRAGRLSFDVRTTWYFVPQIYTYPSPNNRVRMSLPLSINLGYSFKIA